MWPCSCYWSTSLWAQCSVAYGKPALNEDSSTPRSLKRGVNLTVIIDKNKLSNFVDRKYQRLWLMPW